MRPDNIVRLTDELRAQLGRREEGRDEVFVVSADAYRDPAVFARERSLFEGPRIVAASSSIERGAAVPVDLPGVAAVLTRTADGTLRAFENACRHRGTRLTDTPCKKALTCPYHAWTYDLAGALVHVPHADSFPGVDLETRGLRSLPIVERHGLVWMTRSSALDEYLGELDADVAALGLAEHVVWGRSRTTRRCNWKLVMEAFLDGYHIRTLHRDSVYRYFLDAASIAEPVGPHIRAITGRRALREAEPPSSLRMLVSPSLLLFPATIVVEHPDFTSIMTVHPLAPDLIDWDHMMFVPANRIDEREHWDKSWKLIEEGVFQREDLWVCEQAQRSIMAGTVDEMLFGTLESAVRWFHEAVSRAPRAFASDPTIRSCR